MESKNKVETVEQAIKQLMEDEVSVSNQSLAAAEEDDSENTGADRRRRRLFELLSQLYSLKEDVSIPEQEANIEEKLSPEMDKNNKNPNEEIIKELKNVKRQNLITHCLLSAMIVLTVAWQISEVSLVLKIKHGLSNPLKFIGGIIRGLTLKGGPEVNVQEAMKQSSAKQKQVMETTFLPGLKIPELPRLDLPIFYSSDED